ncbi:MAG TPA: TonB family protein [Burkholderiaceae bacterium]
MAASLSLYRPALLPWTGSGKDDARFRRILRAVLAVCVVLGIVLRLVTVPKPDLEHPEELPPRLAKMLLEHEPPVVAQPLQPAAEQARPEAAKPEPAKPAAEAKKPQPELPPGEKVEAARRKAASTGLLALSNELAELAKPAAIQLNKDIKQGPGVGTGTGPGIGPGNGPGIPVRSLITSNATNGSGGINTAGYSHDTGGGGLAGRATTMVAGGGGMGGGGGRGGTGLGGDGNGAGGSLHRGGSGKASRSLEEIKLVFERNKGAIYALYNRALREDPTLEGKVVLELTIAPTGEVTNCRIVSSELRAADLERKLLARIRQFDFGAKNVEVMVVTWPVDFLPS